MTALALSLRLLAAAVPGISPEPYLVPHLVPPLTLAALGANEDTAPAPTDLALGADVALEPLAASFGLHWGAPRASSPPVAAAMAELSASSRMAY